MKKLFIIFALCMFLLPVVLAEIEVTQKFNTQFDLRRNCFNNGTFCSDAAVCNMTITYPDGTSLVNNVGMGNQFSFHNVTFLAPEINQLGVYAATMICRDGNFNGDDTFQMEITGDGFTSNVFPTELSIIIVGFVLIFLGSFQDRLRMFKIVGAMLVFVMGIVTLYPGYSGINYSNLKGLAFGSISIGLGFYFMIEDSFSRKVQEDHYDSQPEIGEDAFN